VALQQKKTWTSLSTSFSFLVRFVWKQGIFSHFSLRAIWW
jgi:hypothetical protein